MTDAQEAVADDIGANVEAAFAEIEAKDTPEVVEETEEVVVESPEKQRDERGRFAKKEETAPVEATEEEEVTTDAPQVEEALSPPLHWSGAAKVRWEKLPRRVQEELLKDNTENEQVKQKFTAFESVIAPHRQSLSMRYGDEVQGIKTMLAYAQALETDPVGTLQYIARERGIDLGQFATQGQELDPQVAQLHQQVQQLQQQLQEQINGTQSTQTQALQQQIEAFARDPRHPYFNDVKEYMGGIIQAAHLKGRDMSLEEAYAIAINADPTVKAQIEAVNKEQSEAEKLRKLQEAKAAQTLKGAPGSGGNVNPAPASTLEDQLLQDWDSLAS